MSGPRRFGWAAALLALAAIATWIRWAPIDANETGVRFERHDEPHYVGLAQRFLNGESEVRYWINPTFFAYLLHGTVRLWGAIEVATGTTPSFADFAAREALDPRVLYVAGRALSMAASVASVLVIAAIGRLLFGATTGVIGGLALAVSLTAAGRAPLCGNESMMTLLVLLAFRVRAGALRDPSPQRLLAAGALLGLATSTKYSAGVFLLPLLFAPGFSFARAGAVVGGTLAGFLGGSPRLALEWPVFARQFQRQSELLHKGLTHMDLQRDELGLTAYLREFPVTNQGLVFALFVAAGCLASLWLALRRRDLRHVLLMLSVLPLYIYLGSGIFHRARFLLPLLPFAALLGAWALDAACARLLGRVLRGTVTPRGASLRACAPIVMAAVLLAPAALAARANVLDRYVRVGPRHDAVRWVR